MFIKSCDRIEVKDPKEIVREGYDNLSNRYWDN